MIPHNEEEFSWLSFELLDEAGLCNAVTLCPLNLAFEKPTDQEEVMRNIERVRRRFTLDKIKIARQVHSDTIIAMDKSSPIPDADALMTTERSLGLLLSHADCQIACFYDPVKRIIASAHAGWRGNVKRLYTKTLALMKERYGCNLANILAAVSPSLGPTRSEFIHFEKEWPPSFWSYKRNDCSFDLWQMAEDELRASGLLPHHIQIARLCTYDNPDKFYSYRRAVHSGIQGPVTACNATLLALP